MIFNDLLEFPSRTLFLNFRHKLQYNVEISSQMTEKLENTLFWDVITKTLHEFDIYMVGNKQF